MKAYPFARKVKHLRRGRFVLVDTAPGLTDQFALRRCPRCGWRGMVARTFARPGRYTYNVIAMTLRRSFAVCGGCDYWEEQA